MAPRQTTNDLRREIYARDGYVCQYCGDVHADDYIIEHVLPMSRGGRTHWRNLVVACRPCNDKKFNRIWIPNNLDVITESEPEWRKYLIANASDPNEVIEIVRVTFEAPAELHYAFKMKALKQRTTMQKLFIAFMEDVVKEQESNG